MVHKAAGPASIEFQLFLSPQSAWTEYVFPCCDFLSSAAWQVQWCADVKKAHLSGDWYMRWMFGIAYLSGDCNVLNCECNADSGCADTFASQRWKLGKLRSDSSKICVVSEARLRQEVAIFWVYILISSTWMSAMGSMHVLKLGFQSRDWQGAANGRRYSRYLTPD